MRIVNFDAPRLVDGFKALGHEVVNVAHYDGSDIRVETPQHALDIYKRLCAGGFVPDVAFYCDSGNFPYFLHIEDLPCPSAFYSIDTFSHPWHFAYVNGFDVVFAAQKAHVQLLEREGARVHWLPLCARAGKDVCRDEPRDIPVAFVGTLGHKNNPEREPFLRNFRAAHPLAILNLPYVDVFNRAQIVLNQTAASEVNQRCFEAMACGAALLMEDTPHGLLDLFTVGEHILPTYPRNDWRGAASTAAAALADKASLAGIARNGRDFVANHHMDRHRAAFVVAVMEDLLRGNAAGRRLEELPRRRQLLASAYGILGAELVLQEGMEAYADYYLKLARRGAQSAGSDGRL